VHRRPTLQDTSPREALEEPGALGVLATWPNILRLSTTPRILRNTVQGVVLIHPTKLDACHCPHFACWVTITKFAENAEIIQMLTSLGGWRSLSGC
jgi:hypothetical protein